MGIVEEEADESLFWMELPTESGIVKTEKLESFMKRRMRFLLESLQSAASSRLRKNIKLEEIIFWRLGRGSQEKI